MGSAGLDVNPLFNEHQAAVRFTTGFWLGKYEVTQREWRRVMRSKPWDGKPGVRDGDNFPATFVNWQDAEQFCKGLTADERRAHRLPGEWAYVLPTDAEWEYACRAGTTTPFWFGDSQAKLPDYAWFGGQLHDHNAPGNTTNERYAHAVGTKRPNAWGLFDMYGNAWEWCRDIYVDATPGGNNPLVLAGGSARVFRGGSWKMNGRFCRSAFRNGTDPDTATEDLGFRVVLDHSRK
jgi:formylglycine-generating enzyme required for sulfatase activity